MRDIFIGRRYRTPDDNELVFQLDRDGDQAAKIRIGVVTETQIASQRFDGLRTHNKVTRKMLVSFRDTINEALADWS